MNNTYNKKLLIKIVRRYYKNEKVFTKKKERKVFKPDSMIASQNHAQLLIKLDQLIFIHKLKL